ncbi:MULTISPECIES: aldose 1-epimerase family protein [unclassified Paenibacillus]|uniref:aldose 1-epimerase family protein n=1 Tax=unclassified Paenibacillus TaxID=185978 RepID=UPI00363E4DB8
MPEVYGQYGKQSLLEHVSDIRQIAGFQRMELIQGKGKGNEVIQVRNGSGLQFQISVSRAFDIGMCEFYGIPIAWMSQIGPVSPFSYEKENWNHSFEGGLLATCGLTTMGKPSVDEGKAFGPHGRISSTAGELLQAEGRWNGGQYELIFRGLVRECAVNGENIAMERTIVTRLGENRIYITDKVTNESFQPVEHLMMHHFNFGFPLIGETCSISIPPGPKRWINGEGATDGWSGFSAPTENGQPTVMLHEDVKADTGNGNVQVQISNKVMHNGQECNLALKLDYDKAASPCLTQWKHPGKGVYVLGIEPGNASTEGRAVHRSRGTLPMMAPGEQKTYSFCIEVNLTHGCEM